MNEIIWFTGGPLDGSFLYVANKDHLAVSLVGTAMGNVSLDFGEKPEVGEDSATFETTMTVQVYMWSYVLKESANRWEYQFDGWYRNGEKVERDG